jgi:hypothetical protein
LILGFIVPLSYAFILSETSDLLGRATPDFLVWPFGWPRPIWILLMGRQPSENDLISGILFMAIGNILLYGMIIYLALLVLSLIRRKQPDIAPSPPPPPTKFSWPA